MWNLNKIVKLKYEKDYIYYIKFDDGLENYLD